MGTEKDIKFAISGSALSFLYYECDKSRTDQIGFLIGERNSYVTKAISDAEINGEKSETVINIVASLTVGLPSQFCNNVGRVDRVKLKEILGSLEKDIYGWYIFRRNAGLSPLLRGTIIHRELLAALPLVTPRTFVLGCFGSDATNTRSTHRLRHIFLRHEDRVFRPTAVHIINFGQEYNLNYRNLPLTSSLNTSVNDVLATVTVSKNAEALTILKALQKPLLDKVLEIADQVQLYEKKARDLANEVQELKYNLTNSIAEQSEQTTNGNKSNDRNVEMYDEDEDEDDDDDNKQKDQVQDKDKVVPKEEEKDSKVARVNEDSEDVVYSSQKQQPLLLSQIVGRSNSQQPKSLKEDSDNSESPSLLDNFQPSEEY